MTRWAILFIKALVLALFLFPPGAFAQIAGMDVAGTYQIADKEVKDGDIIVNSEKGFVRATIPYDNNIFGVYSEKPLLVFRTTDLARQPIVRSGMTQVNVVGTGGAIKAGDYITSSEIPGKGEKAAKSGYVLGIALGDFSGSGSEVGRVPVALRIEYAELTTARSANRLLEYLGGSFFANVKNPEKFGMVVRYILAGMVLLVSFGFGFWTFSRALPKAVEAIGRNPLARHTIYLSMALNVGLIGLVGVIGIIAALLVLRM